MSLLSRDVEFTLQAAFREAESRRHQFVTLEHLLFALLHGQAASAIVRGCGGDVAAVLRQLERHFGEALESAPGEAPYEIDLTDALHRVIDHVHAHAQSAEQGTVGAGDVLAALLLEERSHAAYFLRRQGISRLDVLEFISHRRDEPDAPAAPDAAAGGGRKPAALSRYAADLNLRAGRGEIDPLIGRTEELARVQQILGRRYKNNPLLVGDAGVGKTAIAEGLARLIALGEAAPSFADVRIFALDMGALLAGTRFRGDFEARLKAVMADLAAIPDAVLFIDEIHTIVGAGATGGGSMDASNILKPQLASGGLRCIGATTHDEYRRSFEKDHALSRRFQKVAIDEPSRQEAEAILRGLAPGYERFHGVRYSPRALRAAVELSDLHVADRRLPDKAIDVLDEAGSEAKHRAGGEGAGARTIDRRDVQRVVARMTGRPLEALSGATRDQPARVEAALRAGVFGQDAAIEQVMRAVKRDVAGMREPQRPIGSFLFVGPSGVGKTELARRLAAALGVPLHRFDMSEYLEKHTASRLIGAPPGYVGHESGGLLTGAVIKAPHCVVLLDEVEKAHPDIFDLLLQIMDYGALTDAEGRSARFQHTVLLMTSNAGSREMTEPAVGFAAGGDGGPRLPAAEGEKAVKRLFRPEFINRLDAIVTFDPIGRQVVERIVDRLLADLAGRLRARRVTVTLTGAARAWLAERGHDPAAGARPLIALFQREVEDRLTDDLLAAKLPAGAAVSIGLDAAGALSLTVRPPSRSAAASATRRS